MKKAIRLKNIKKAIVLNKPTALLVTILVAVILIGGVGYAYYVGHDTDSKINVQRKNNDQKPKIPAATPNNTILSNETETPLPSASPETPTTTDKPSQPKVAKSKPGYSPAPTPTVSNEFRITSINLDQPYWNCDQFGNIYASSGASLYASNTNGGAFTWVVDVTGSTSYPPTSTPIPVAFPAGQAYYFTHVENAFDPRYSEQYVKPGTSFRFRITSPNSVASSWYTIPANATCPR